MGLFDTKTGVFDRLEVAVARDRAGDAGGPELHVAAGALLERLAADDVGDREPSAWPKDARGLGEDALLGRREVDHAVRDHDVEDAVLERESIDARLGELDLAEAIPISQREYCTSPERFTHS